MKTFPNKQDLKIRLRGGVTRAMAQDRARELAPLAGGLRLQVTRENYEQAKCELTGESDPDLQDAIFDQQLGVNYRHIASA